MPIDCVDSTASIIANNTIKKHHSLSMEMQYFWIADQIINKHFTVQWHPWQENLAIHHTKQH